MTHIDDAPAAARDASLQVLMTAFLGWLGDVGAWPDGTTAREIPRLPPTIDEFGLLRCEERWVSLTPTEERVMRELLDYAGRVCSRTQLVKAGWPTGLANERLLDTYVRRLRAKIPEFGLGIRTVRKRGFLLEFEGGVM